MMLKLTGITYISPDTDVRRTDCPVSICADSASGKQYLDVDGFVIDDDSNAW